MIGAIQNALSGLASASQKLQASASNIANLQTVGSLEPGKKAPYAAQTTVSSADTGQNGQGFGVKTQIKAKNTPFVPVFDPDSPFADENGVVGAPNVSLEEEAVNQILAQAQYKANLATLKVADELSDELLRVFDEEV